ncbi:MAG: tetratricopeptide repeat protein [Spirochaetia bacterium]|jgi:tetratricopeptide (TPR) repeat protein|nr:tetratricopeptide repeat protein [Spirochaetia bacterium]
MQHQEKTTFKQKLLKFFSDFLSGNWKMIIIFISAIFLFAIGATVYNEVRSSISDKATMLVEEIEENYFAASGNDTSDADESEKINKVIESLDEVIDKYGSFYAAQKAMFMKGDILFQDKQYDKALDIFLAFSVKYKKSYLAPIALNNAAVCYEDTDQNDKAVELYKKIETDYVNDYPDIAHVVFSLGRLHEKTGDYSASSDYYNLITSKYTNSDWTNFARDRIIYLKSEGKIDK